MLTPRSCASRALNSLSSLPNAAISVGQTNVKSFGEVVRDDAGEGISRKFLTKTQHIRLHAWCQAITPIKGTACMMGCTHSLVQSINMIVSIVILNRIGDHVRPETEGPALSR